MIKLQKQRKKQKQLLQQKLEIAFQEFSSFAKEKIEKGGGGIQILMCSDDNPQLMSVPIFPITENNILNMMEYMGVTLAIKDKKSLGFLLSMPMLLVDKNSLRMMRNNIPVNIETVLVVIGKSIDGDARCELMPYTTNRAGKVSWLKNAFFDKFSHLGWTEYNMRTKEYFKYEPIDRLWTAYKFNLLYNGTDTKNNRKKKRSALPGGKAHP